MPLGGAVGLIVQPFVGVQQPSWQELALSGGGYVRTIDIHTDGTMLASGDVFPLFMSTTTLSNKWKNIFTPGGLSSNDIGWSNGITGTGGILNTLGSNTIGFSVWDAKIAPTSSSIFYISYSGRIFKSTDKGNTWNRCGTFTFTWPVDETNDQTSTQFQHKLAIDPANANCVVAGTPSSGFFVTTDGGVTWTQPTGTPTSTAADTNGDHPGATGIVFDASSGTTGGLTNTVYAAVFGSGVWRTTTTVNGAWSLIASSPTQVLSAFCTGGVYYCAGSNTNGGANQTITSSSGGAWTTVTTDANGIRCIALNPNITTNIVYINGNGSIGGQVNTNGTGHTVFFNYSAGNGDCPALHLMPASANFYSPAQIMFDPNVSQRIWFTCGIGVFYTDSITGTGIGASTTINSIPRSAGMNSMVTTGVISPPGGQIIWGGQDRQEWQIVDPTVEPSTFGVVSLQSNIFPSWNIDWASANPSTIVSITNTGQGAAPDHSQFSTNGGASWTLFSSLAAVPWTASGVPQHIAASSSTNFCVLDHAASGPMYFTTNGGSSWTTATGLPATGFPSANKNQANVLCADRVSANTFYVASTGNGLYTSTNSGSTWSLVAALPTTLNNWHDHLQAAPNNAGHLWLCVVNANIGPPATHPQTTQSYRSVNGGSSWTALSNVEDLWCLGFGQSAPSFSYPTIWIVGWVKIGAAPYKYGVWVSKDAATTWTWLVDYPAGSFDYPVKISGDSNDYTKCYVGMAGSTIIYGKNLVY